MSINAAEIIEKILQKSREALPDNLTEDVKGNVRAAIQEVLKDLDVVTREELDVQQQVLSKTREKVDHLQSMVDDLEKKLDLD